MLTTKSSKGISNLQIDSLTVSFGVLNDLLTLYNRCIVLELANCLFDSHCDITWAWSSVAVVGKIKTISEPSAMRFAVLTALLLLVYIQDAAAGEKHTIRKKRDRKQYQRSERYELVLTLCSCQFLKNGWRPSVKKSIHPNHVGMNGTRLIPKGVQSTSSFWKHTNRPRWFKHTHTLIRINTLQLLPFPWHWDWWFLLISGVLCHVRRSPGVNARQSWIQ